ARGAVRRLRLLATALGFRRRAATPGRVLADPTRECSGGARAADGSSSTAPTKFRGKCRGVRAGAGAGRRPRTARPTVRRHAVHDAPRWFWSAAFPPVVTG